MVMSYQEFHPDLGERVFVAEGAAVIGRVRLEEDASVFFQCVLRADINSIRIGARSNIQDNTTVHVSTPLGTRIGSDVSVGHGCIIHACDLGDRILVGMGSIVMDGVKVGSDCIIGAGSLLTKGKTFPEGSLVVGNPAKAIRPLTPDEKASIPALAAKYVGVKDAYLAQG